MTYSYKIPQILTFISILVVGCQKDNTPEPEPLTLFSVNLDNQKFNVDYKDTYIAAYTTDGRLIDYGSLSDSSTWELKAAFKQDSFDIVYFEIWHNNTLIINHIKNVDIGHSFTDPNRLESDPIQNEAVNVVLKVEDFGNHDGNNTGTITYEKRPHLHKRGYAYAYGEFIWDKIEDGYGYKNIAIDLNPIYQGTELIIFERGTNSPYTSYLDLPATTINSGDTITLNKSDFNAAGLNTIQVNSSHNDFNNIFLYTYHSMEGRKSLITSFEDVVPDYSGEKNIRYVSSDILPISYWNFRYFAAAGTTSYTILSNKVIPSTIDIKELTGYVVTSSENKFDFTHGNIFPDKNLVRSSIQFDKSYGGATFNYILYFDGNESIGNTTISPINIPEEILANYDGFEELDNMEWEKYRYLQTYTNIPGNSPLDYLNSLLIWIYNESSVNDYTFEEFSILL